MRFLLSVTLVRSVILLLIFLPFAVDAAKQTGKAPVIIIPGLTGSDLYDTRTGERVWFKLIGLKGEDIRLPITSTLTRNTDHLETRDILREVSVVKVLPEIEIYERLIHALATRGGYKEGRWDEPEKDGWQDTFYVFPYDWRRDNVENARALVRKIESLKQKLGRPNLKFNVLSHSMGGLIARYAAMYGNSDIPASVSRVPWAGARHFDKIFLLGTPNGGSVSALNALLNGSSLLGGGLRLPFIRGISKFDIFTMPSIYQLLPHENTAFVYDERLQPMKIDIYDPKTWENYGWSVWSDDAYKKRFKAEEIPRLRGYFAVVLNRAKRFHSALNAGAGQPVPVNFILVGGDCKETLSGVVLRRDSRRNRWITSFKPESFTNSDRERITPEMLKPILFTMGDNVVPKSSLSAIQNGASRTETQPPPANEIFQCEGHTKLVTSPEVQDKLLEILNPPPA
ncbi:MAG TPA: hypothetical protein PKD26_08000 [Pyrinomonadaceae bacterium]|nr:hypothetical protein [Pyrinomonadaceae bacterium]